MSRCCDVDLESGQEEQEGQANGREDVESSVVLDPAEQVRANDETGHHLERHRRHL